MEFLAAVLDHAKVWQTLFGSVLGFLGVMWTLWFNARKARELLDRNSTKERELLHLREMTERDGLLTVLRAELENCRDEVESLVLVRPSGNQQVMFVPPRLVDPIVYKANLGRIRIVGKDAARAIIKAYEFCAKYEHGISFLIEQLAKVQKIERMGIGDYCLDGILQPQVLKACSVLASSIKMAIQAIDDQLQRSAPNGQ